MRLGLLCLLLPLAAAQFPSFNIFNIPESIRNPLVKTYFDVMKVDTQCFRDIKKSFNQILLAFLTAQKCKTIDCLMDEKVTNASYAMKMLAATGHPHSLDMDELSLTWAGDPKLCRNIEGPFETKYCFLHVTIDWKKIDFESLGFSLSFLPGGKIPDFDLGDKEIDKCTTMSVNSMKLALCLPASCEKDANIGRIVSEATNGTAHICEISCVGPKHEPNSFFYLFNIIFVSLIAIAIGSSILDYLATRNGMEVELKGRTGWKVINSFSILRNTSELFSLRQRSDSIPCLDAIRFITFTWVVNGHCDLFVGDGDNPIQLFRESDYILSDVLLNAYVSVDTFFLVSGLLVSYTFFKRVHNNPEYVYKPLNWIMYYAHRWLRLTPAYVLFIAFYVAWTPQMHDIWAVGTAMNNTLFVQNCENYWWLNALYLNNFHAIQDLCYPPSWFLCVDTQLYWAAPLFLIAIFYSWKTGLGAVLSGVLFSVGATIFLTAYFDLPAIGFTAKTTGNMDFMTQLYIKPWIRCIPYLTGIICGYFIVQVRKQTVKIRQPKMWELAVGWLLATAVALTVIFSVYDYMRGESDWSVGLRSLYGSFARIGWALAVASVVLACTFNWAGPIKSLLEHPLWYPLGRLSYCAFLAHWFTLQLLLHGSDRPAHFVSLWQTYLTVTIPVCFLSYAMAYIWSCLVEIPFSKLEVIVVDLIMHRGRGHRDSNIVHAAEISASSKKPKDDVSITTIEVDNHH